mmetsp:Transcript_55710/g.143534  ORF Transcript_55710/g.143534 Transcript_55710/m.143534 type:complete len:230 (-) Transcript_55710:164-853(-)
MSLFGCVRSTAGHALPRVLQRRRCQGLCLKDGLWCGVNAAAAGGCILRDGRRGDGAREVAEGACGMVGRVAARLDVCLRRDGTLLGLEDAERLVQGLGERRASRRLCRASRRLCGMVLEAHLRERPPASALRLGDDGRGCTRACGLRRRPRPGGDHPGAQGHDAHDACGFKVAEEGARGHLLAPACGHLEHAARVLVRRHRWRQVGRQVLQHHDTDSDGGGEDEGEGEA